MSPMTSSPAEIQRKLDQTVDPMTHACGCMGPQRDEPLCPCAMQTVIRWRGRWVKLSVVGDDSVTDGYLGGLVPDDTISDTPAQRKWEWDVYLTNAGDMPANVMKVVRDITALGISDIVKMRNSLPALVSDGRSRDEAEKIAQRIREMGGSVELR